MIKLMSHSKKCTSTVTSKHKNSKSYHTLIVEIENNDFKPQLKLHKCINSARTIGKQTGKDFFPKRLSHSALLTALSLTRLLPCYFALLVVS